MPTIYDFAERFRAALLARDQSSARQLIQAYGLAFTRLQTQLSQLTTRIQNARAAGEEITPAWLQREERFKALMQQVGAEIGQLANFANDLISLAQQAEVERALRDSGTLLTAAAADAGIVATFNQVNPGAVASLVGALGDGSPLRRLLQQLPGDGRREIERALIEGVTLGENPRKVARRMRDALGGNLTRALRIARTEQIRAYREASRATYRENSDLVTGWQWLSARQTRTCASCWAMDGQIFPVETPLGSHPQCRCSMIPVLESAPLRETGEQAFARLPEAQQREILGDAKYTAYRNGEISLRSLVGYRNDRRWGETRWERGLKDALRGEIDARWGTVPGLAEPIATAPAGPAGKPIAPALKLPARGNLARLGRNVLGIIDRIHGDGDLPLLPVRAVSNRRFFGAYSFSFSGRAGEIMISRQGDHPELTLAHEIGHFLDHQGVQKGTHMSARSDVFAEFRQAAEQSRAIQEIRRLAATRTVSVTLGEGDPIEYPIDRVYLSYLLKPEEIWARAYAQYIAVRSDDPTMREQLNQLRQRLGQVYYPAQWDDDEFEPIAEAMDRLMLRLGWRK
ncbi:MAG: minor capsid protein [Acidobacteria bacterium]|nr:minor capsid protein [Acidobacteriota bacterium]